jgi:hypothetical protein
MSITQLANIITLLRRSRNRPDFFFENDDREAVNANAERNTQVLTDYLNPEKQQCQTDVFSTGRGHCPHSSMLHEIS